MDENNNQHQNFREACRSANAIMPRKDFVSTCANFTESNADIGGIIHAVQNGSSAHILMVATHFSRCFSLVEFGDLDRDYVSRAISSFATRVGPNAWGYVCNAIRDHWLFDPAFEGAMRSFPNEQRLVPNPSNSQYPLVAGWTTDDEDDKSVSKDVEGLYTATIGGDTFSSPTKKGIQSLIKAVKKEDRKNLREKRKNLQQEELTLRQKAKALANEERVLRLRKEEREAQYESDIEVEEEVARPKKRSRKS